MNTKIIHVPALADPHVHFRNAINADGSPAIIECPVEYDGVVADLVRHSIAGGADYVGPMPNSQPALTTAFLAGRYRDAIMALAAQVPDKSLGVMQFMMLTEGTDPAELERASELGIKNVKLYPRNRTTNSSDGIRMYHRMMPLVKRCGELGITCHFHPEHPWLDISGRDAESMFIPLVEPFLQDTSARIVWEHGSDGRCVPLWERWASEFDGRVFVTLTPHHLIGDDDTDHGNVAAVCKPPIKSKLDRHLLLDLVRKDYPWVMAGSDSAYHPMAKKHVPSGCCACGAFLAPWLAPLYAHALDDILVKPCGVEVYKNFTSGNARNVHGLSAPSRTLALERVEFEIPKTYKVGVETAMPFMGGEKIRWRFVQEQ